MYEVSWHFVHSFTSYSRLSGLLSPSSCIIMITHRHTRPWKQWPNWTNYDSNWLLTHILQTWPPATIICSQTSSGGSRERDSHRGSHRGNRGVFRRLGHFVLQKRYRNVGKSLYQVYRSRKQLYWGINITLPKKRLFSLKISRLFNPCNTLFKFIMKFLTVYL